MKKLYRKGRRSADLVKISFSIERRYARFLIADARFHEGSTAPLGGFSGIVAKRLRDFVRDMVSDSGIEEILSMPGFRPSDFPVEVAEGLETLENFYRQFPDKRPKLRG